MTAQIKKTSFFYKCWYKVSRLWKRDTAPEHLSRLNIKMWDDGIEFPSPKLFATMDLVDQGEILILLVKGICGAGGSVETAKAAVCTMMDEMDAEAEAKLHNYVDQLTMLTFDTNEDIKYEN